MPFPARDSTFVLLTQSHYRVTLVLMNSSDLANWVVCNLTSHTYVLDEVLYFKECVKKRKQSDIFSPDPGLFVYCTVCNQRIIDVKDYIKGNDVQNKVIQLRVKAYDLCRRYKI